MNSNDHDIGDDALEAHYMSGEYDKVLAICWERLAANKSSPLVNICLKKTLRTPEIAGVDYDSLRALATAHRKAAEWDDVLALGALGAFKFPGDRFFCLLLADSLFQLEKYDLVHTALAPLGTPKKGDVVLLNAHASLAHAQGDSEGASIYFKQLLKEEPNNHDIAVNYSASLHGLKKYGEAQKILEGLLHKSNEPLDIVFRLVKIYSAQDFNVEEKLEEIDARYFSSLGSKKAADAHAQIRLFLQDLIGVIKGLEASLSFENDLEVRFSLAETQIAAGQFADGFDNYGVRFDAFPKLAYFRFDLPAYKGQYLADETLVIWGEQGIGDEILFSLYFEELARRVKNVTVTADDRLIPALARSFPDFRFVDRRSEDVKTLSADFACPSADLMCLFSQEMIERGASVEFAPIMSDPVRSQGIAEFMSASAKKKICIAWRGGNGTNGKIRSMALEELMAHAPDSDNYQFISLQFEDGADEEVIAFGDRRVQLSGLDNKHDLEGVFALMSACDAILSVDCSVAHFGAGLRLPTFVVVPAGQTQYRWKNPLFKNLLFPDVSLYSQDKPGEWGGAVKRAWKDIEASLAS